MRIRTNNVPRPIVDSWDLPESERQEFHYYDWQALEEGRDSAVFVQYKGVWYDLSEFTVAPPELSAQGWQGIDIDTYFSGTVMRYVDDDHVIMGRVYS